jgi:uncharacterized protein (TIGR03067 family)
MLTGAFLIMGLSQSRAQAPNPARWVLDNMQGDWTLQAQYQNGQLVQGVTPGHHFVIEGNRFSTRVSGRAGALGTIGMVDPLSNPLKMDFIDDGGTVLVSIVRLEGDTMRYCGADTGVRPTDFVTRPGDGRSLSVWRRVPRGR